MAISVSDRLTIRELAKQLAQLAARPGEREKAGLWRSVNRLQRTRPPIYCFVTPQGWKEIISAGSLTCEDKWARAVELELRKRLHHALHFHDDTVIDADWPVRPALRDSGWGLAKQSTSADHEFGARRFDPVIIEERDIERIQAPRITVDWDASERELQRHTELLGDILNVRQQGLIRVQMAIMDDFIQWRGIEQTFMDMIERPQWVHEAMERMTQGVLGRLDQLERLGLLSFNHGNQRVGSGGWGWTEALPQADSGGAHARARDMWGHATTQIFSAISPDMHAEFAIQYERRFLERFGLSNYGCCEPLHDKVGILRPIKGLRRISMSPWINVERGAAAVGADYVFSYKPNPAVIAADRWNPQAASAELVRVFERTRGCVLELVLKDVETCRREPHRLEEWTILARELAGQYA